MLVLGACATHIPASIDGESTTQAPETTQAPANETTKAPETTVAPIIPTGPAEPEYINPLTGLATTKEIADNRPVAIMLNNIKVATPQDGISSADVIYECMAEGGITRLMMVTLDHASIGVVGSVRSARDYFVDLSQNHDAIFVHAGGSDGAYVELSERKLDCLDFVNGRNVDPYYYRDPWRVNNMGKVHSIVTTGARLAQAFAAKGFRTEISSTYDNPFKFVEYGTEYIPSEGNIKKITIPHSILQTSSFVYDSENNTYDHYQFGNVLHIDRISGEKVSTTNVIVLFMNESPIPNDPAYRIKVDTIGEGDGLYLYGGKYVSIKWKKTGKYDTIELTKADGTPLEINRGKTFISITATSVRPSITVE